MNEEHFPRWTIYYNFQMDVCTGTTEVNGHIIYKISTLKLLLLFTTWSLIQEAK